MTFILIQLQRFGGAPLGLIIEGGSESPLNYIFIKSVAFGSPAFNGGVFVRGDQLVMVGRECVIGLTLKQAQLVLERAPDVVEVVAQRKESVKQSPLLVTKSEAGKGEGSKAPEREREERDEGGTVHERERLFTESVPVTEKERERSQPRFRRSTSQSDIWMTESGGLGGSTSLGYANTDLSASLNIARPGGLLRTS